MSYEEMKAEVDRAKEHVEQGEAALKAARPGWPMGDTTMSVHLAEATAHFTAAMAITNILLTEPSGGLEEE